MKPSSAKRVLVVLSFGLMAAGLRADEPRTALKPAKRGGYGTGTAETTPSVVATPVRTAGATGGWLPAATAHVGAAIDEITQRFAAANRAWAGTDDKQEQDMYRQFYSNALTVLTKADLRRVANPTIYAGAGDSELIYQDGNRAAVEAALTALDGEMAVFRFYDGVVLRMAGRDGAYRYLQWFTNLRIFAGFERLVTAQKNLVVRRTNPLVSLVDVASRMDPFITGLMNRSDQVSAQPAIKQWKIEPTPFVRFYDRQLSAIGASLRHWFVRGGATEEELGRIDGQMKATAQADPEFIAALQKLANYEQQKKALLDRSLALSSEIATLDGQARSLRGNGDYAGASALDAQAEPLARQEAQLDKARGQISDQESQDENQAVARAEGMNFDEPVPSGHVTAVEFILATEFEPAKGVVPEFPLKGAPVSLSYERQVTDVALAIPFVIRVGWEQDEGTAPAEQTLNLAIGGKSVALAMHVDPYGSSYTSSRVIFLPPPAAPPAPPAQP